MEGRVLMHSVLSEQADIITPVPSVLSGSGNPTPFEANQKEKYYTNQEERFLKMLGLGLKDKGL
jgi:hypothetical protein